MVSWSRSLPMRVLTATTPILFVLMTLCLATLVSAQSQHPPKNDVKASAALEPRPKVPADPVQVWLDRLVDHIAHPDALVRGSAQVGIAELGRKGHRTLQRLLNSKDTLVAEEARRVVKRIDDLAAFSNGLGDGAAHLAIGLLKRDLVLTPAQHRTLVEQMLDWRLERLEAEALFFYGVMDSKHTLASANKRSKEHFASLRAALTDPQRVTFEKRWEPDPVFGLTRRLEVAPPAQPAKPGRGGAPTKRSRKRLKPQKPRSPRIRCVTLAIGLLFSTIAPPDESTFRAPEQITREAWLRILIDQVGHQNLEVRRSTCRALVPLGRSVVPELRKLLESPREDTRHGARVALEWISAQWNPIPEDTLRDFRKGLLHGLMHHLKLTQEEREALRAPLKTVLEAQDRLRAEFVRRAGGLLLPQEVVPEAVAVANAAVRAAIAEKLKPEQRKIFLEDWLPHPVFGLVLKAPK